MKNITALLNAKLLRRPPAWLPAMTVHPPTSTPVLSHSPTAALLTSQHLVNKREQLKQRTRHEKKRIKAKDAPKAPKINFPEDKIRLRFFREFPLEAIRHPINLKQQLLSFASATENIVWDHILADGTDPQRVNGENVVQRWLYLTEIEHMESEEAYHHACNEYFMIRQKADAEKCVSEMELQCYSANPSQKSWTRLAEKNEQEALLRSAAFIREREELYASVLIPHSFIFRREASRSGS